MSRHNPECHGPLHVNTILSPHVDHVSPQELPVIDIPGSSEDLKLMDAFWVHDQKIFESSQALIFEARVVDQIIKEDDGARRNEMLHRSKHLERGAIQVTIKVEQTERTIIFSPRNAPLKELGQCLVEPAHNKL